MQAEIIDWLLVAKQARYFVYNPFWVIQQQDTQQDPHYTIYLKNKFANFNGNYK